MLWEAEAPPFYSRAEESELGLAPMVAEVTGAVRCRLGAASREFQAARGRHGSTGARETRAGAC